MYNTVLGLTDWKNQQNCVKYKFGRCKRVVSHNGKLQDKIQGNADFKRLCYWTDRQKKRYLSIKDNGMTAESGSDNGVFECIWNVEPVAYGRS